MKPSTTLINFIKKEESLRLNAYLCPAGVPTIGYGSTMYPNGKKVKLGETISKSYAEALITWEVENKARSVAAFTHNVVLKQGQFDSLVSFAYNLGVGALEKSTLLKKIRLNPNSTTMIPFASAQPNVQNWMTKTGMKEINIIHHEFMKWVMATNPRTGKLEVMLGLQRRRQREWEMYSL